MKRFPFIAGALAVMAAMIAADAQSRSHLDMMAEDAPTMAALADAMALGADFNYLSDVIRATARNVEGGYLGAEAYVANALARLDDLKNSPDNAAALERLREYAKDSRNPLAWVVRVGLANWEADLARVKRRLDALMVIASTPIPQTDEEKQARRDAVVAWRNAASEDL